jgi:hypothetical protein
MVQDMTSGDGKGARSSWWFSLRSAKLRPANKQGFRFPAQRGRKGNPRRSALNRAWFGVAGFPVMLFSAVAHSYAATRKRSMAWSDSLSIRF